MRLLSTKIDDTNPNYSSRMRAGLYASHTVSDLDTEDRAAPLRVPQPGAPHQTSANSSKATDAESCSPENYKQFANLIKK